MLVVANGSFNSLDGDTDAVVLGEHGPQREDRQYLFIKKPFWNDKAVKKEVIMLRSFSHVRLFVEAHTFPHILIRGKASIVRYIYHDAALTFVVLELVKGGNLEEQHSVRPFTHREVEIVVRDVLDALSYVHSHGVIYHDIKPENILVSLHGRLSRCN